MKTVLSLKPDEARDFFLKNESYCNFDIPEYFNFETLLNKISKEILNKDYKSYFIQNENPNNFDTVNYRIIGNKDGKYAWRPYQLIHPFLYVALVQIITEKNNWNFLVNRFNDLSKNNRNIACVSLPAVTKRFKKDKAEQISRWTTEIEQESIITSLDFDYLYHADITDCYGSIYTHSIPWSLHTKEIAKGKREDKKLLGNKIDSLLQSMSNGQTNGIPQGSTLMDFIAEILLCYIDSLLGEKIKSIKKTEYRIIRYRDDYRIFSSSPVIAEKILKDLTDILNEHGLKINSSKTFGSSDSLKTSIKQDKFTSLVNPKKFDTLTSELYYLSEFSRDFPNSGQLAVLLNNFYKKVEALSKKDTKENIKVLISIVTDIAYKNPRTYQISASILSIFLNFLSKSEKKRFLNKIITKFSKLPNTGIMQLWLQRITLKINISQEYSELLCQKVRNNSTEVWESIFLNQKIKKIIKDENITNKEFIEKMPASITRSEVDLFQHIEPSL